MFKTNVNQKSVPHIRDGIEALKLPDYVGTAVLNRITDDNGQAVLSNKKPISSAPYLFVKTSTLNSAEQQSIIDVVTNAPSAESVEKVEAPKREALQAIRKLESQESPRRLSEALPDDAGGSAEGRAWLKANRDKIIAERAKL